MQQAKNGRGRGAGRGLMALGALGAAAAGLVGCNLLGEQDSWLWDQSIVGRWENTPTIVPILERIDVIERDEGEFIEVTGVTPEDLIPVVEEYQLGPGDHLRISVLDFLQQGALSEFEVLVDITGAVDLPQIGRVMLQGLTVEQAREAIAQDIVDKGIAVEKPVVSMTLIRLRQATFSVFGAIQGVGRYSIPAPDYRLLEALTEAGGINPALRKVRVIRQVRLSEELRHGAGGRPAATRPAAAPGAAPTEPAGQDLTKLIEELTRPGGEAPPPPTAPATPTEEPSRPRTTTPPPIELVEGEGERAVARPGPSARGGWVFLNGEWVQVGPAPAGRGPGLPEGADPTAARDARGLVTQRIIEVPTGPLLQGLAQYNIVIRPGDVLNIPGPDIGLVYLGGPGLGRPGVYELPSAGRLTLKQAVIAAGGLSPIGIPERVDLTRRIGDAREATIRLNLRAIFEGTQPDIFLKPDDQVNVGTNFFATPLAVIRSGFRITYGFGFLVDRNFGSDLLGVPPEARARFGF